MPPVHRRGAFHGKPGPRELRADQAAGDAVEQEVAGAFDDLRGEGVFFCASPTVPRLFSCVGSKGTLWSTAALNSSTVACSVSASSPIVSASSRIVSAWTTFAFW